tara:strand:+ start:728 stop:985 length:258 start_codon:yes stop_codon:yes gene_type:complete
MTTAQRQIKSLKLSNSLREAIVDKLRECKTTEEILDFENWFNHQTDSVPLYVIICEFLQSRSISRVLAAKWLKTLLNDRENKLSR